MREEKSKQIYVDIIKVMAIFLVMNSHLDEIYPISALATGGAMGNALFFICAGYCLREENLDWKWICNKIVRLYLPTILFTLLFCFDDNVFWFEKYIWPTEFWFIGAMALFYFCYWLINKIKVCCDFRLLMLIGLACYFSYYFFLLDTSEWVVESVGLSTKEGLFKLIYYFMIMITGKYFKDKTVKYSALKLIIVSIISVIGLYLSKYMFVKNPWLMHFQFLNQFFVYIFALATFLAFGKIDFQSDTFFIKVIKSISWLSKYSLEIYIVQFGVIDIGKRFEFPLSLIIIIIGILTLGILLNKLCGIILKCISGRVK